MAPVPLKGNSPLGPIVQKYSIRICYDAAIPVYAKGNTILEGGSGRRLDLSIEPLESTQELLD